MWRAQYAPGATTAVEAMQVIWERMIGQVSMETFEHFEGIDEVIEAAIEPAAEAALGRYYRRIERYGSKGVFIHQARRAEAIELGIDFYVEYGGWGHGLGDAGKFNEVFQAIHRTLRKTIEGLFPEARVYMTHRFAHDRKLSLQVSVHVEPKMQLAEAA